MATYQHWLAAMRAGREVGNISDLCGPNPASWRNQLPKMAPSKAAGADYAQLEDRLFGLLTDLDELDAAWGDLGARLQRHATAGADQLAEKLAAGDAITDADITPHGGDINAEIERDAETLVKQATAARAAIAQIVGKMGEIADHQHVAWLDRSKRRWQTAAHAASEAQYAANRAAAEAEEAYTCYLWVKKLPGSITHGAARSVQDGDWQSDSGAPTLDAFAAWDNRLVAAALQTKAFKRPDYMDADGACYVVNQSGTINGVDAEHFGRLMRASDPNNAMRPAGADEIARYWRQQGWTYDPKTGTKMQRRAISMLRLPKQDAAS